MRVLYFSRDYTTHDRRFVAALTTWGASVAYLRLEDDGVDYIRADLPSGADWVAWAPGRVTSPASLLALLPDVVRVIEDVQPDVIQAGPVQTCGLLSVLAAMRPTVVVSWGSDVLVEADRDAWHRWATARALRGADGFLCDSAAVLARARAFATLPDECVASFPWGLDLAAYERDESVRGHVRRALGWDDAVVAISTRAWHPAYRISDVLDAFATACDTVPSLRLILAGGGADATIVESRLRSDPRFAKRIHRPGMVTEAELRRWLMAADVYVSSAPSDGTSVSLLEAMALALPVIVVDNPGNRAWVHEGEHGWLVPAGAPGSLASALVAAATDLDAARAMGARAHGEVGVHANWHQNVKNLFMLFGRLLLESRRSSG